MKRYVDGFVLPVPTRKLAAYRRMAKLASEVWRDHGALDYVECVAEDSKVPMGLSFAQGIKAKRGETIVFAWVAYKSRAHRDKVNALVMKDPRLAAMCDPKDTPFDCNRMLYGGFEVIVSI